MSENAAIASLERRCTRLEEELAFQDATVAALNAALTEQQRQFDVMEQRVLEMQQRFQDLWDCLQQSPQTTLPPHYHQAR